MKLLHIIASVDPAYGGPVEGILRQNEACGGFHGPVQREVATLDAPDAPFISRVPFPVHALGPSASSRRTFAERLFHGYRYSRQFLPWLNQNVGRFDAVIVHGLWEYAALASSWALPESGIPYFVFPHGMMDPWFRRVKPLKHLLKQALWWVGEGNMLAKAKGVLFTTEEERLQAQGAFWGPAYEEIVVSYGAGAPPPYEVRFTQAFQNKALKTRDREYILFLSRIHPKKGCDLLVKAFSALADLHPEFDLVIAGPDATNWQDALKAEIPENLWERIHWPGALYHDEKWGALYGASAFILPSHQENFGIAVAEALGCGTPVLISDKVNIWREIDTAEAGFIAPDTVEGTKTLILRWFQLSTERRDEMAMSASRLFRDKFDVAVSGPALIALVKSKIGYDSTKH